MNPETGEQHPDAHSWSKSSYSSNEGGECVEVAATDHAVLVRDSKDLTRPTWPSAPRAGPTSCFTPRVLTCRSGVRRPRPGRAPPPCVRSFRPPPPRSPTPRRRKRARGCSCRAGW
ncbi:DUF397 domain-containing protein [Streptomyces pratensis]|uniref:DUF397 domain-containing protein n=1 Tax=Streptomyces pratensis TaxID=1169025 RepID=UPI0037A8D0D2